MGLDMNIYKARKLSEEESKEYEGKILKEEDLNDISYDVFRMHGGDREELLHDLMPYATKAQIIDSSIDFKKMEKDYGRKINPLCFFSDGSIAFGEDKTLVTAEEVEKYRKYETIDCIVVDMKEHKYWRKAYDIQEKVYDMLANREVRVDNCGFYELTREELDKIAEMDEEFNPYVGKEWTAFYHEWY